MATTLRWTVDKLEALPEPLDDTRYEIIDGALYVTTQPSYQHQTTCARITRLLDEWSESTGLGVATVAPGLVFGEDEAVAPDVVWTSRVRLPLVLGDDGKFHDAPDLVVEVLSPGATNERRDRETKLLLYSRRAVAEYWIVDWRQRLVDVYRHDGEALRYVATLGERDVLASPLLPGFSCAVSRLFTGLD